jgi:hypothetical protein
MSTSLVSVCAAIILVACIVGRCSAAAPLGTVNAELFTDAKCTVPYLNYGFLTETNVALDGSACQSVNSPTLQYANIISCSAIGSSQYYYEQYWPSAAWCTGPPLMTFTHVAPRGACSALHWTYNGTTVSPSEFYIPPLYAQLLCTPNVNTNINTDTNSASSHTHHGSTVAAIAAALSILLLSLVI